MRDIKFKVWDKENNCWHEPTYKAYAGKVEELLLTTEGDLIMRTLNKTIHESMFPGRFVVARYTGLMDMFGNPVYENDILMDLATAEIYVVEYSDGAFYAAIDDGATKSMELLEFIVHETQILGSSFENSKLQEE